MPSVFFYTRKSGRPTERISIDATSSLLPAAMERARTILEAAFRGAGFQTSHRAEALLAEGEPEPDEPPLSVTLCLPDGFFDAPHSSSNASDLLLAAGYWRALPRYQDVAPTGSASSIKESRVVRPPLNPRSLAPPAQRHITYQVAALITERPDLCLVLPLSGMGGSLLLKHAARALSRELAAEGYRGLSDQLPRPRFIVADFANRFHSLAGGELLRRAILEGFRPEELLTSATPEQDFRYRFGNMPLLYPRFMRLCLVVTRMEHKLDRARIPLASELRVMLLDDVLSAKRETSTQVTTVTSLAGLLREQRKGLPFAPMRFTYVKTSAAADPLMKVKKGVPFAGGPVWTTDLIRPSPKNTPGWWSHDWIAFGDARRVARLWAAATVAEARRGKASQLTDVIAPEPPLALASPWP